MQSTWYAAAILVPAAIVVGCARDARLEAAATSGSAVESAADRAESFTVAGSGVHYFSTAVVHSRDSTAGRIMQRSTDIIRVSGDLNGYVLYHPVSEFDLARGALVNTGTQLFSGTVAGSEPVLLHDDKFRFEVDLETGATTGQATFRRSSDAPAGSAGYECRLTVTGTGVTPEGDNLADYRGECTRYPAGR